MERVIETKGRKYLITGKWTPDGMNHSFDGQAECLASNNIIVGVQLKLPFSMVRKYGQDAMDEEICISVREHLENKA